MLKQGITAEELKIYDLYLQRIMKEYDLIWSRFKIYSGLNSGVLVIVGFLVKPHLVTSPSEIPDHLLGMSIILTMLGIIFSVAWFLVNKDGRKWMLLMNDIIAKVEDFIFEKNSCSLYKKIKETYSKDKPKMDVEDINLYVAGVFFFIWLLLLILSTIALFVSVPEKFQVIQRIRGCKRLRFIPLNLL